MNETRVAIANGTVIAASLVRMRAKMYSFQELMKQSVAVAIIPGATNGNVMRLRTSSLEQPSIRALSSNASGISPMKPSSNQIKKVKLKVV